jgi:uncharacterized protein (TIGR00255 family)
MMYSMTAFARTQVGIDGLMLTWELRSVNHRYLEIQFRLPEQLRAMEHGLREIVRKRLNRGKVDCTLRLERSDGNTGIKLNRPVLLQVLAVVEQIRRDAPELGPLNPMDLLRWPGVTGDDANLDDESVPAGVTSLFEDALTELIAHRQREGEQLNTAIKQRLDAIEHMVSDVKTLTANISGELQRKLTDRLRDLPAQVDPGRLEQEVALLAQRADIAEELDRLSIHVEEARGNLGNPGPHGRRLDFLTQELNREANTLGSKSVMAQTSQKAVDLKVIIEQIREQVQNIE